MMGSTVYLPSMRSIKAIIHFAASKAVGESVQKPLLYYRNNLGSLINLLELMPKHGVEGIVFSSHARCMASPTSCQVTEEAPIKKAESPYGNTKQINEEIIRDTVASGAPIRGHPVALFQFLSVRIPLLCWASCLTGFRRTWCLYLTQTAIGIPRETECLWR